MVKVGIIGATGYAGNELVRILFRTQRCRDCMAGFKKLY